MFKKSGIVGWDRRSAFCPQKEERWDVARGG